jgi:hypothetical protein
MPPKTSSSEVYSYTNFRIDADRMDCAIEAAHAGIVTFNYTQETARVNEQKLKNTYSFVTKYIAICMP